MKTLSKLSIGLLSLIALSIFSCKKELAPLPVSAKLTSLPSSDYGRVTTVFTGLTHPKGLAIDAAHNLYIIDMRPYNVGIYKITPAGVKTFLAGGPGIGSDDGTGAAAHFSTLDGMTFGPDSALYVADEVHQTIRKITLTGVVTTIAGLNEVRGHQDGPVAQATFFYPIGIKSDAKGNLYVAEFYNQRVRVVTFCDTVYTLAGSGAQGFTNGPGATATFYDPVDVAIDHNFNVYVADFANRVIRKITPDGTVSTFAGSGAEGSTDGVGTAASFSFLTSLVFDSSGNLYAADFTRIRKITPDGVVSTLAGSNIPGSADGVGTAATFSGHEFLAVDRDDNLYASEVGNGSIRKIVTK
jgi:hypothetical protein